MRELIFANKNTVEIREVAIKQGMATLYLDGLLKVIKGMTTLEEIFRVAKRTEQDTEFGFQPDCPVMHKSICNGAGQIRIIGC